MNEARNFWEWFVQNEALLRPGEIDDAMLVEFEKHLFRIGQFDWEIGPSFHVDGRSCFALSPGEDPAVTDSCKGLLAAAPALAGWEFLLFKPPRRWQLKFDIRASVGVRSVDATLWEFVVYAFDDGTFDVLFKPDASCQGLSQDELMESAEVIPILDGELGEATRRARVVDIEIVEKWGAREIGPARRLEPGFLGQAIPPTPSN